MRKLVLEHISSISDYQNVHLLAIAILEKGERKYVIQYAVILCFHKPEHSSIYLRETGDLGNSSARTSYYVHKRV